MAATDIPLLLLLGGDDDEADPRSCIDKAKENAAKGMPVEFKVFSGTTHAFDHSLMADKPFVFQQGGRMVTCIRAGPSDRRGPLAGTQ